MIQFVVVTSILVVIAVIANLAASALATNKEKKRLDEKLDDALAQSMHGSESTATY